MLLSLHPNIIVNVENVVSFPSLAHKKYESVAAINFFLRPYSVASWSASPELPKFAEMLLEKMLLSLHPNIIVHVENVVSLFSSPSLAHKKYESVAAKISFSGHVVWPVGLLLRSCPSLQRCCWKVMLLSLHPNIIVHVENVVSLFSSPSTSSQKVRKCGSLNFFLHCLTEYL